MGISEKDVGTDHGKVPVQQAAEQFVARVPEHIVAVPAPLNR